jgi:uncharacterized protein (TIGR04222 family)
MDWLTDNFLANMSGVPFLEFYAVVAALTVTFGYLFPRARDRAGSRSPPLTPPRPDPYEMAYLRGGGPDVIRAAIFRLQQARLIEIAAGSVATAAAKPAPGELNIVEQHVLDAIKTSPKPSDLFKRADLKDTIERFCAPMRARLHAQNLLQPDEVRSVARACLFGGGALLAALGGYKLALAIAHGRTNTGFLIILTIGSIFALALVTRKAAQGNASALGRAWLEQVRLAHAGNAGAVAALSHVAAPRSGIAVADGGALLLVSLYGYEVLKGTPHSALADIFAKSGGSDGGSSCGSGDGGGGCSGCSGGGD